MRMSVSSFMGAGASIVPPAAAESIAPDATGAAEAAAPRGAEGQEGADDVIILDSRDGGMGLPTFSMHHLSKLLIKRMKAYLRLHESTELAKHAHRLAVTTRLCSTPVA